MGITDNSSDTIGFFRPDFTQEKRLFDTTIARDEILDDLLSHLRKQTKKKRKQHFVFIGPRGIGKSHLLRILEYSIKNSESLQKEYIVIRFPEENLRLLSFADFLLGVIEILGDVTDNSELKTLFEKLEIVEDDSTIIDTILTALKKYSKNNDRSLLILLENLDMVFGDQIKNEISVHQFRKFLLETPLAVLVGTSPTYFPGFYDIKHPLYDFFDIQTIEELSESQTIELIKTNLKWEERFDLLEIYDTLIPKIRSLHDMTGGNPRLILMLYALISQEKIYDVTEQFKKLLDNISPFYQERIKELAPQERGLLETIALMRSEPRTPANIAKKLRKSPQQTSALLKRLLKSGYLSVIKNEKDKRSNFYRIKEGFFDIWLVMSLSRVKKNTFHF
jgi:replication-associated recombination protein RarA